jgi:DNA-binding CsgD family transcriptional regulator
VNDEQRERLLQIASQRRSLPTDKQLAEELGVSLHTVKGYMRGLILFRVVTDANISAHDMQPS